MLTIDPPECDWMFLPHKDKRKGGSWLCRVCGHFTGGKVQPDCPCETLIFKNDPLTQTEAGD